MIVALLILHALVTIVMIGLILLQKSDGSGPLGIGGGGNALFTARGVANILTRTTAVLAALFIGNCLLIGVLTSRQQRDANLFTQASTPPHKAKKKAAEPAEAPSQPEPAAEDVPAPETPSDS